LSTYFGDGSKNNRHVLDNNDDQEHHVKIHIETPYRKSNTPIPGSQHTEPIQEHEFSTTTHKRQLFQLMPFPKLVSSRTPRKQRDSGNKRNGQSKPKMTKVQKRDHVVQDESTRVPFFAESNLGIVHNRHKEESFESFEKKHNILKIQKRATSGWGTYGNVARGTVHGQLAEKNPILQLLRSAAGTKTQKILGLNSKSFDIFPGPLPEESASVAKTPAQASLTRMRYPANDQMITRPHQAFFQGNRPQYRSFRHQRRHQPYDYPQMPMMSSTRRGIRPRAVEMGPPTQPENYPVNPEQMLRRGNLFDASQQYIAPQRVPRQSFAPPISQNLQEPSAVDKEDFYQPNEAPALRSNFDRYSSSMPLTANGVMQNGETQQQEKLIEDQINQINQDEGAQDQRNNLFSRQDLQSILSPTNSLTQLPKVNDQGPAPFLPEENNLQYNKAYQPQPSYFMNRPQPQRQFEEDEQALRRRVVPMAGENPRARVMPQLYQGQQFNPMVNEGANIVTQHQSRTLERERQPANVEEDDEEKPEVHVHISTEKRKMIAKPENGAPSKTKEIAKSQAKDS